MRTELAKVVDTDGKNHGDGGRLVQAPKLLIVVAIGTALNLARRG